MYICKDIEKRHKAITDKNRSILKHIETVCEQLLNIKIKKASEYFEKKLKDIPIDILNIWQTIGTPTATIL